MLESVITFEKLFPVEFIALRNLIFPLELANSKVVLINAYSNIVDVSAIISQDEFRVLLIREFELEEVRFRPMVVELISRSFRTLFDELLISNIEFELFRIVRLVRLFETEAESCIARGESKNSISVILLLPDPINTNGVDEVKLNFPPLIVLLDEESMIKQSDVQFQNNCEVILLKSL